MSTSGTLTARSGVSSSCTVSHEYIGIKSAALALEYIAQPAGVGRAVLIVEKASCPIVPALYDVQRQAVDAHMCASRHGQSVPGIEPDPVALCRRYRRRW
jgi:hypothetical protein